MGLISKQRLGTGLSTLLDLIAIVLFFVQYGVGDADWIRDEFIDYRIWASVSDLGILDVVKAIALVLVYSAAGVTHLGPCLGIAIVMSVASTAKMIAFIVHRANTKSKLPGLHFVLPILLCAIAWIQLFICRLTRNMDRSLYYQLTQDETASFGDYGTIQADYPAFKTPTTIVPRRRFKETEPLLTSDSLGHSVPITVIPSVPLNPPALNQYASAAGLDQRLEVKSKPAELPPPRQIAALLFKALPRKTYIRSLRQIHNAFATQDVLTWLTQTFPTIAIERSAVQNILAKMLEAGWIESPTQVDAKKSPADLDNGLFIFTDEAFNELDTDEVLT